MKKKVVRSRRICLSVALCLLVSVVIFGCAQATPTPASAKATAPAGDAKPSAAALSTPAPAKPAVSSTAGPSAPSATTPRSGGVLKLADATDGVSIGFPARMTIWSQRQATPAIEALFRIDNAGVPIPWLATGYTGDVEARTIALALRKGVKFHDGTDFNAEAVKWNLDTYTSAKTIGTAKIKSIDVVDDSTVRINLTEWDNTIIAALSMNTGMMISPTAFKTNGQDWAMNNPVGTGPFQFVSWQKDVKTVYKKFDGYWQKGKPYLDGIEWIPIADPVTRLLALRKGEVDLALSLPPNETANMVKDGFIAKSTRLGSGARSLVPDSANPNSPFADVRVRQAAQYALDMPAIVDKIVAGAGEATNQYGYKGHWGYNSDVAGYPYNPAKAKQLLAEAGYANGFKTKVLYSSATQPTEIWPAIQGYLQAVGIDAELDAAPAARWSQAALQGGKWEGLILAGGQTTPDLAAALSLRYIGDGPFFSQMLVPDDFKKAVQSATTAPDTEAKQKSTREAMKLMIDKYALQITLYAQTEPVVSARYVQNHGWMETPDTTTYTPSEVWMDKR